MRWADERTQRQGVFHRELRGTITSCFDVEDLYYPLLTKEEHAALIPVLDDFLLALEYARNPPRGDIE